MDTSTEDSVLIDVCVRNPFTHNTWEKGRFTSYEIAIRTNVRSFCLQCSITRRRFKEFDWLHKCLKQHHPLEQPPALPPKKFFGERFDPSFIAFRMKSLEEYLNRLLQEDLYLSDEALHLFLQSNLTTAEIDQFLKGKISSEAIEELWKCKGDKSKCQCFGGRRDSNPSENEEIPYLNDDDSLSDSESKSNESDIEASVSDVEYPCVTLVLPNSSRTSPMDKVHNKTPLQFATNNPGPAGLHQDNSINMVKIDSVGASHSINGET
ncbi:sorting nexin-10-like [Crassostrea virginica]|uniref:Sorting nexin-10-like n=1 Tax=Crassostrea virginica TaxID=6565 RepID=A0A8B8AAG7_CRAVI|nr:sorting nexin-10-like [Crassostrea virginica]